MNTYIATRLDHLLNFKIQLFAAGCIYQTTVYPHACTCTKRFIATEFIAIVAAVIHAYSYSNMCVQPAINTYI